MKNAVIAAGTDIPDIKALDSMLTRFGIINTLKQLRAFIREHPNHLDARADLLKEARRRALIAMPKDINDDLGEFDDLRVWGVLSRELDLAFTQDWVGIKLDFFRPDMNSPEKFSPVMRTIFRKHIAKIEAALMELPSNESLWDIWGWMARALDDRPVFKFVQTLDPFNSNCPSPKVAAWLTNVAKSKSDWENVIKMARIARGFTSIRVEVSETWSPNLFGDRIVSRRIEGYPEESSYYPQLEALLKLGKIYDANDTFDELIRSSLIVDVKRVAEIANSAGFRELSEIWSKGVAINEIPFCKPMEWGIPQIVMIGDYSSPEYQQLRSAVYNTNLGWPIYTTWDEINKSLNWTGNNFHYALIDGNGHVIYEGTQVPSSAELEEIIEKKSIIKPRKQFDEFLKKYPSHIETLVFYGIENILEAINTLQMTHADEIELNSTQDEMVWGKIAGPWTNIMSHEYAMHAVPSFYAKKIKFYSPLMKSLSKRFLPKIEAALHNSPSSNTLWNLWLFWRQAGDNERDFEKILNSIQPSPCVLKGSVPPASAFQAFYIECKENNRWPQIIKLLSDVWDREISKQILENNIKRKNDLEPVILFPKLGDDVGVPLLEALLRTSNRQKADEVFNIWLECGGSFSKSSDLIGIARQLEYYSLANEWEKKIKTSVLAAR
ncbi:MAG: hypothetical protein LBH03_00460 [Holophagales bacterium]|jgi:hypothetical protein|nr:hypothetical protein [Holophagales bacterium]